MKINKKILLSMALITSLSAVDKFKAGDVISADVMNEAFESITRIPTTADLVGEWSCEAVIPGYLEYNDSSWVRQEDNLYYSLPNAQFNISDDNDGTYSLSTSAPSMLYMGVNSSHSGNIIIKNKQMLFTVSSEDSAYLKHNRFNLSLISKDNFIITNTSVTDSVHLTSANCQRTESIPENPQNLTATVSSTANSLSWTDMSTTESEFNILRKDSINGEWQIIDTVNENANSYEDHITEVKSYWYRVQAKNTAGVSSGSNVATTVSNGTVTVTSSDVITAINTAVSNYSAGNSVTPAPEPTNPVTGTVTGFVQDTNGYTTTNGNT